MKEFIIGQYSETTYAEVAEVLDSTEDATKTTAHRIRRRYRESLRNEIADIVATPDDIEKEIRSLLNCFRIDIQKTLENRVTVNRVSVSGQQNKNLMESF